MVLARAAALTAAGAAVGLAAAFAAGRLLQSMLFGVAPHDPVVFTAAPLALAAGTRASSSVPARRTAGLDPLTALRQE